MPKRLTSFWITGTSVASSSKRFIKSFRFLDPAHLFTTNPNTLPKSSGSGNPYSLKKLTLAIVPKINRILFEAEDLTENFNLLVPQFFETSL